MSSSAGMENLLRQANYILNVCGRPVPPKGTQWVDIPSAVGYSRFLPAGSPGVEDIGGVLHKGRVPFIIRAVTAQALPRATQGTYWRLRIPSGKFFQSELTSHAMAFGFGSDRQVFDQEIIWPPGEKLFIDLNSIISGTNAAYSVVFRFEGAYRFPVSGAGGVTNPLVTDDVPRYFIGENQNILAPEFRFGPSCPSETPVGFEDEEFCYCSPTVDLPITGSQISNVETQVEASSDFILRQIWPNYPPNLSNQGTGNVVVRLTRGDGYAMSSNFVPIASINGPVFPELKIRASDNLYFDAAVTDGAGSPGEVITFGLYLYGVRRRVMQ
jgi:hypothetical protein